jgi:serine/threonine protein kinase
MGVEWKRVRAIFERALDVAPERRAALLDAACDGDAELRREVEALLAARERAGNLLEAPAAEIGPTTAPTQIAGSREEARRLGPGSVLDGKYRIDEKLGQGGMGAVYLATHLGTKRAVAVKVIVPERTGNPDFLARFKREAEAAGRLRHPNVVDVTDFGMARIGGDEVAYLVMEYLDGFELSALLREERRLPLDAAVDILEQTCLAIDEAHRLGIVHRDIKPQNIWLEPNRRGGHTVKVLDFGIAKLGNSHDASGPPLSGISGPRADMGGAGLATTLADPRPDAEPIAATSHFAQTATQPPTFETRTTDAAEIVTRTIGYGEIRATHPTPPGATDPARAALTQAGTIMGSAHYMSPEQCLGRPVDARSDVYSLGVVAYELLAGEKPFDAPEPLSLLYKHIQEPAPSLRAKRRAVPAAVDELIRAALEKDPAKRPAGAALFARSLRARAEGPGTLFRRALILFLENLGLFLRISLLALLPVFLLFLYGLAIEVKRLLSPQEDPLDLSAVDYITATLAAPAMFFSWAVSSGLAAILLAQITRAPLRRLRFAAMWRALRGNLIKVVLGGVLYIAYPGLLLVLAAFVGMIAALLALAPFIEGANPFAGTDANPAVLVLIAVIWCGLVVVCAAPALLLAWWGLRTYVRYSLFPVVTVIEGAGPRAAFRRSKELVSRSPWLVAPIVIAGLVLNLAAPLLVTIGLEVAGHEKASGIAVSLVEFAGELLFTPVLGAAYALAYLRLREFGGESQEQVFAPESAASTLIRDP